MIVNFSRKCFSSLTTSLLLVLVVFFSIFLYQTFFSSFMGGFFSQIEGIESYRGEEIISQNLVGSTLFLFASGTVSSASIRVNGELCLENLSFSGRSSFDIGICLFSAADSTPEISVYTRNGIYTNNFFLNNEEMLSLPSLVCPDNYSYVEGNSTFSTSDFCVMKYEAKDVGGVAASLAEGFPWTDLTWQQAVANCTSLGSAYHLITENEWLTVAGNIYSVASNWNTSVVGSGFVFVGHTDDDPSQSLEASSNDSLGYYGVGDSESACDGTWTSYPSSSYETTSGLSCFGQKRVLTLSSGDVIWDFSGNAYEFVNDTILSASRYHGGDSLWLSYHSDDGTGSVASNVPALKLPPSSYNAFQGTGRYFDGASTGGAQNDVNEYPDYCTGLCASVAVFIRGGGYEDGFGSGTYALTLFSGRSRKLSSLIGFRCVYTGE